MVAVIARHFLSFIALIISTDINRTQEIQSPRKFSTVTGLSHEEHMTSELISSHQYHAHLHGSVQASWVTRMFHWRLVLSPTREKVSSSESPVTPTSKYTAKHLVKLSTFNGPSEISQCFNQ